jgi:hypothetical protein
LAGDLVPEENTSLPLLVPDNCPKDQAVTSAVMALMPTIIKIDFLLISFSVIILKRFNE